VVDDNATNRTILARQLEAWGSKVTLFSDPVEALAALAQPEGEQPGLILLDYHMPHKDGLSVCEELRRRPHLAKTPILILTSVSFLGRRRQLDAAGADGQLTKPVKQSQLRSHILLALGVHDLEAVKAPTKSRPLAQQVASEGGATRKVRVLLVEDNAVNQRIGVALLERAGYQTEVANNGREGLAALAHMPFDLVLMDCQMPILDGYDATRGLREIEARTGAHIPVIAMTAHVMQGDREKCLQAGMDDYVAKPVVSSELYEKISYWLARSAPDFKVTA